MAILSSQICKLILAEIVTSQSPPAVFFSNKTVDVSGSTNTVTGNGHHTIGPINERFRGMISLSAITNPRNKSFVKFCKFYALNEHCLLVFSFQQLSMYKT